MDKVWQILKSNNKRIQGLEQSSVSVLIKLTSSCRSQCRYCLSWKTEKEYLSPETLKGTFSDISRFSASRIAFSGGEPTTHPDFKDIIQRAKKNCDNITVITDGQFLNNQEWFPFVDELIFSIDSTNPLDYKLIRGIDGLDSALQNLRTATKSGIKTAVNIVLTQFALKNLSQSIECFVEIGVNNVYLLELETHLGMPNDLIPKKKDFVAFKMELLPMLKSKYGKTIQFDEDTTIIPFQGRKINELSCLIPFMHLTIRPNGDVYPCCRIGDDNPEGNDLSYCLGNIKKSNISDMWTSPLRKEIVKSIINNPPLPCKKCSVGASFDNPNVWDQIKTIRM